VDHCRRGAHEPSNEGINECMSAQGPRARSLARLRRYSSTFTMQGRVALEVCLLFP